MPHKLTPEELRGAAYLWELDVPWRERSKKEQELLQKAWSAEPPANGTKQSDWCRAEADRIEKESKEKDNG